MRSFRVPRDFRECVPVAFLFENRERVPVAFLIFMNAFANALLNMGPLVNSRSLMIIASGAQLSAHFPAKERRSTRAREIFLAFT